MKTRKFLTLFLSLIIAILVFVPSFALADDSLVSPNYDNPKGNVINIGFTNNSGINTGTVEFQIRLTKNGKPYTGVQNLNYLVKHNQGIYAGGQGVVHTDKNGYLKNEAGIDIWSNLQSGGEVHVYVWDDPAPNAGHLGNENALSGVQYHVIPYSGYRILSNPTDDTKTVSEDSTKSEFNFTLNQSGSSATAPVEETVKEETFIGNCYINVETSIPDFNEDDLIGTNQVTFKVEESILAGDKNAHSINNGETSFNVDLRGNNIVKTEIPLNFTKPGNYYYKITATSSINNNGISEKIDFTKAYSATAVFRVGEHYITKKDTLGQGSSYRYSENIYADFWNSINRLTEPDKICFELLKKEETTSEPETTLVENIEVTPTIATVSKSRPLKLATKLVPESPTNSAIKFFSNDESVAKVDQSGNIEPVSAGTAVITAEAEDGSGQSDQCLVTVEQEVTNKPSEEDNQPSSSKPVEEPSNPGGNSPSSGTGSQNQNQSGSSTNQNHSNNTTTNPPVSGGSGSGNSSVVMPPTSGTPTTTTTAVTGVKINKTSASVKQGETVSLSATVEPTNATNKNVSWSSDKTSVAKVDENGVVTAVAPGSAKITVKTADGGKTASCTITVTKAEETAKPQPKPEEAEKPETNNSNQPTPTTPSNPETTNQDQGAKPQVYRLYLAANNEHLYTTDANEYESLKAQGWSDEKVGWNSPSTGAPVYRLYSPETGEHHYTSDENEVRVLSTERGWSVDNGNKPLFYSGGGKPIYRLYHEGTRRHHLTTDKNEYDSLVANGWTGEGVALECLS